MFRDWTICRLPLPATLRDAIAIIDRGQMQIAIVVDGADRLLGAVTDGDIRRGLLSGLNTDQPVEAVMNQNPVVIGSDESQDDCLTLMTTSRLHQLLVVDADRRVVGLCHIDDLLNPRRHPNPVVIMAGGLGTRLHPLTETVPKPLLRVGGKPILELIIDELRSQGFWRFYIAINYLGEQIETYFGDGSSRGIQISYLREQERLGTAGALSLLPEMPADPVVVMNGDIITKLNFGRLLSHHADANAPATIAVCQQEYSIPYGVVEVQSGKLTGLQEKPSSRVTINAGIYVINPDVLARLQSGKPADMTTLIQDLLTAGQQPSAFLVTEYWLDIGRHPDFLRAGEDYDKVFR